MNQVWKWNPANEAKARKRCGARVHLRRRVADDQAAGACYAYSEWDRDTCAWELGNPAYRDPERVVAVGTQAEQNVTLLEKFA